MARETCRKKSAADDQDALLLQTKTEPVRATLIGIYALAGPFELAVLSVSALCAVVAGVALPMMTVVYGTLAGTFRDFFLGRLSRGDFESEITKYALYFVYIGIGEFITVALATFGFNYTGGRIVTTIRKRYLAAVLHQNIGFFDSNGAGELGAFLTESTNVIQDAISDKMSQFIMAISTFVAALVIAFIKYWLLALILSSSLVAITLTMAAAFTVIAKWSRIAFGAQAKANNVSEESFSFIRTVTAFAMQQALAARYIEYADSARYWAVRFKSVVGLMTGAIMCLIYLTYALAFWQGSHFLISGQGAVDVSTILTIMLSMMVGAYSLGNITPSMQAFGGSSAAAGKIFAIIYRQSPIESTVCHTETPARARGSIILKNISHIYPSRPNLRVLNDISINIAAKKTTALVGASGSGKSTIAGLIERFYLPIKGTIELDGTDISTLDPQHFRRQIGYVGQEPVIFRMSVYENIVLGLVGTDAYSLPREGKMALVIKAAQTANAHDFITQLPDQYNCDVGERGGRLSGGQKQRIAIARAIIRDPPILILDEATSALDTQSERLVQLGLEKASVGRTVLTIAHRLSTIRDADRIIVLENGQVREQGTYDTLMQESDIFRKLITAQSALRSSSGTDHTDNVNLDEIKSLKYETQAESKNERRSNSMNESESAVMAPAETKVAYIETKTALVATIGAFSRQNVPVFLIGLLSAIISGAGQPAQSVLLAKSIVTLSQPASQYRHIEGEISFWAWMYFMLAVVLLLSNCTQGLALSWCAEALIRRAREVVFRTALRQDISYFDALENRSLSAHLSGQITQLAALSGPTLGSVLSVLTTITAAFILSLALDWRLALVCIATVPVVLACGFLRLKVISDYQVIEQRSAREAAAGAVEALSAVRTIASLTVESEVCNIYSANMAQHERKSIMASLWSSALYAMAQSFTFFCLALTFWWGGHLIEGGELSLQDFFIVFSAVIFGAQSAGQVFSHASDISRTRLAAIELHKLLSRSPSIDHWSRDGIGCAAASGALDLDNVHFTYPRQSTAERPVLRGIRMKLQQGGFFAIVGGSGSGKSTLISLLERFYDVTYGVIRLDGVPIADYNLAEYRDQLALVAQEPDLFSGTIRENILLAATHAAKESWESDPEKKDAALEEACRTANIFTFIQSLPHGLDTEIGSKGVLLSGGQKQRIAIARALIRNPKILLLDEATSALDSDSEKVVQEALSQAAQRRTTIAVAHRLSSIKGADRIFVLHEGALVEEGTHEELLTRGGRYATLASAQQL